MKKIKDQADRYAWRGSGFGWGWALACELNLSIEQDKAIYRLARDEEMKSEE